MTLLVKSSKGGSRLDKDLTVLNYSLGVHVLLLSEPFAIYERVMLGKLFMIFFLTFYCTLKTVNF